MLDDLKNVIRNMSARDVGEAIILVILLFAMTGLFFIATP
jgi:hypothetical protein